MDLLSARAAAASSGGKRAAEAVADEGRKKAKFNVAVELQAASYRPSVSDVQNLLLRLFTSEYGDNPRWVLVRGMGLIRTAAVFLVPCLDGGTLEANGSHAPTLARLLKGPSCVRMRSAAEIEHFPAAQATPLVACRLLQVLLSARAKPAVTCRRAPLAVSARAAASSKLPISTYLATAEERARSGYPPPGRAAHPGWSSLGGAGGKTAEEGGGAPVAAAAEGEDPDRALLVAIDCEMVTTASGPALARCSLVGPDGGVLYDSLVQPAEAVTDFLTPFSGITAEALRGVTVTMSDVQAKLREILSPRSILVGHSLENDLEALQFVHERVVDTALIYPHARGWPHRNSLAGLSSNVLKRKLDRRAGHDSVADARAALDLALLKFEKGPGFAAPSGESTPLGRLLRAAGTRLSLQDPGAPQAAAAAVATAAWHLEGCEEGGRAVAAAGQPQHEAARPPAAPREVSLIVMREYERLCEHAAAAAAAGQGCASGGPADASVAACLAGMDGQVKAAAMSLAEDELLIVLSGCGNFHLLHRLEEPEGPPEAGGAGSEFRRVRARFKDAFGLFALGGPALRAQLAAQGAEPPPLAGAVERAERGPPQREPVCYDL